MKNIFVHWMPSLIFILLLLIQLKGKPQSASSYYRWLFQPITFMYDKATPLTAFLTGVCSFTSFFIVENILSAIHVGNNVQNVILLITAAVFFIIPVIIFVVGLKNKNAEITYFLSKEHWINFSKQVLRMVLWFAGVVSAGFIISLFE